MHYYNLHTHHFTGQQDVSELVNQYPDTFDTAVPIWSIGIHPWRIDGKRSKEDFSILESKLQEKGCYAIGECGLDKRIEMTLQEQLPIFEQQLLLAQHYNKPVIIHCVAAFQEVMEAKRKLRITVPLIIHGFSKNAQLAESLVKNGFYISFGKYLLRNPELESVFSAMPGDRLFLETDTIEESIKDVYTLAAKYRKMTEEELSHTIAANFNSVFGDKK